MARVSVEVPENEPTDENEQPEQPNTPEVVDTPPVESPEPEPETSSSVSAGPPGKSFQLTPKKLVIAGAALLLIILISFVTNLMNDRDELKQQLNQPSNTQTQEKNEAENLKREVGQLIELPPDELPTIATVVDAAKVKNQSFFANAQNGDKVLLFSKAGKAILYRPSTKKIIEVAPINIGSNETQPGTGTQTTPQQPTSNNRR